MDIQMPEMDGLEATAAIRQREKPTGKHIPIIAMTAHAMRGDKEKYLAGGMDGYVSKPIHPSALFAEIEDAWRKPRGSVTGDDQSKCTNKSEYLDRASLLERVEGDQELLAEMIHLFVEDAPRQLAAMHDALQQWGHAGAGAGRALHEGRRRQSLCACHGGRAAQLEKNAKSGDMESSKSVF